MELKGFLSEVKFSDRVIGLFNLLTLEVIYDLVGKMAVELFLHREKEEKIRFLHEEVKNSIQFIKERSDRSIMFTIISLAETISVPVKWYAKIFKKSLQNGIKIISQEDMQYIDSIKTIESLLESSDKNSRRALVYSEFQTERKNEILDLPKIKSLIEIISYLQYLDMIYQNLDAVENNRQIVTQISQENKTNIIIKDHFESMHKNKWQHFFSNEVDYNAYCDLLTVFFEHQLTDPLQETIKLKSKTQTLAAKALRNIHKELGETLIGDTNFIKFVKVLSPFKEMTNQEVYKVLIR